MTAQKQGAVIGIGGIGIHHATWMKATNRIQLAALCDVNPDMAARAEEHHPGVPFYTSMDDMFANHPIDLAAVVVPHNLHAPIAIAAMEKGANVIVEKPMATRYADCVAMIDAAKRTNRFVTVFHNRRLDGWYLAAKSALEEGLLGDLVQMDIGINFSPTAKTWRGWKEKSGGIMYDWGAHLVDYALNLDGSEVKAVSGFFYNRPDRDPALNEDHGTLRIYFESGAIANITSSGLGQAPPRRYFIVGTKGSLVDDWQWGADGDKLKVYKKLTRGEAAVMDIPYPKTEYQKYYDALADSVCDDAPLMVTPESAAKIINIFNTAERSHAQGGVPLPLE